MHKLKFLKLKFKIYLKVGLLVEFFRDVDHSIANDEFFIIKRDDLVRELSETSVSSENVDPRRDYDNKKY